LRIQTQAAQDAANAAKDSAAATLLQITMMKKKERARLVITPLSEGYWKTLHEASGILRSSIKIDHFGTTDAFKVRGFFTISVSDSNRVPPRSDIWAQMDIPEVIKTDSPPLFPQHEYFWWTKEDLPKILSENAFLIFYGMIIFEDMFDEEQTEEFGFYWFVDHASIEKGLPGNSRWVECDSEESQKKRERLRKRLFPFVD
jgi:hypothetical protein